MNGVVCLSKDYFFLRRTCDVSVPSRKRIMPGLIPCAFMGDVFNISLRTKERTAASFDVRYVLCGKVEREEDRPLARFRDFERRARVGL